MCMREGEEGSMTFASEPTDTDGDKTNAREFFEDFR